MDTQNFSTDSFRKYSRIILICILITIIVTELFLRIFLVQAQRSTPKLVHDVLTKNGVNVVVGDSQMYRAFFNVRGFVNLSRRGTPIPAVEVILSAYFADKKPNKIIFQAAPHLFSDPQLNRGYQRYDEYFNTLNYPIKLYLFEKGIAEFIGDLKLLNQVLFESKNDSQANSDWWKGLSQFQRLEKTKNRILHHQPNFNRIEAMEYKKVYRKMIEKYIAAGAEICLVRPPVSQEYYDLESSLTSFQEAKMFFTKISKEYNIKLVNFKDLDLLMNNDFFINQDHITPKGSDIYAELAIKACFEN